MNPDNTPSAPAPHTAQADAHHAFLQRMVVFLGRGAFVALMCLYILRLLFFPQYGIGSSSYTGIIGAVLGALLIALPWQGWSKHPGRLLTMAAAGAALITGLVFIVRWQTGASSAWAWPVWAMSIAALVGAAQLYWKAPTLRTHLGGMLFMLCLMVTATLLTWLGPQAGEAEAHWLTRSWLSGGGIFLALLCLMRCGGIAPDMPTLRQRIATLCAAWMAALIVLTSIFYPWMQAHSLHPETQQARFSLTVFGVLLLVMSTVKPLRRWLPSVLLAFVYAMVLLSPKINGSVGVPAMPFVALGLGLLLPIQHWRWAVGLWAAMLVNMAIAPNLPSGLVFIHSATGTLVLAMMLWLNQMVSQRSTANELAASKAPGSQLPQASLKRSNLLGFGVGLTVALLGSVGLVWLNQSEVAQFSKKASRAANYKAQSLFRLLDDYEQVAERLAMQSTRSMDSQASFEMELSLSFPDLPQGVTVLGAPKGVVTHLAPFNPDDPLLGRNLLHLPGREQTIQQVVESASPSWEAPHQMLTGETGIVYRVPYNAADGSFGGIVAIRLALPQAMGFLQDDDSEFAYRILLGANASPRSMTTAWQDRTWNEASERLVSTLVVPHQRAKGMGADPHHWRNASAVLKAPQEKVDADLWMEIQTQAIGPTPETQWPVRLQVLLAVSALLGWLAAYIAQTRMKQAAVLKHEDDLEQIRAMFNKSMTGMRLFTADGQYVMHNPAAEKNSKHAASAIPKIHLSKTLSTLGPEIQAACEATLADGQDRRATFAGIGSSGNFIDLEFQFSRLTLNGRHYLLTQSMDMSEVHASQQATETVNQRLKLSLETARLGTFIADVKSMSAVWDERLFDIFGVPEAKRVNPFAFSDFLSFVHEEDREAVKRTIQNISLRQDVNFEHRVVWPDGTIRHVTVATCARRTPDGHIFEELGIVNDITPLKEAELAERHAREAAEKADRAKTDFVANVSHELRTPVNGIVGMLEQLKLRNTQASNNELIDIAWQSAQILLSQVNDVLDFFKLSDGKMQLELEPLTLGLVVPNELRLLLLPMAQKKGLWLEIDILDVTAPPVLADAKRLRQIFLNLASNAIKFTDQGSVKITAYTTPVTQRKVELCVEVEDTGQGMPAEFLPHLFDRFTQVQSSANSGKVGTGLGMAITKQLVDLMGGHIEVESELGKGTRFTVKLPFELAKDSMPLQAKENSMETADVRGMKVLYAEDNEINRAVMETQMGFLGVDLTVVEDGSQAVERIIEQGERYDVVFLDAQMPIMNGLEAAAALRQQFSKEDLPIFGLSAGIKEAKRLEALEAGMNDFLSKPMTIPALANVMAPFKVRTAPQLTPSAASSTPAPTSPLYFDADKLIESLGGSKEAAKQFLTSFLDMAGPTYRYLEAGVKTGNPVAMESALHSFKGSVMMLYPEPLMEKVVEAHEAAMDGRVQEALDALPEIHHLYARTVHEVRLYLN